MGTIFQRWDQVTEDLDTVFVGPVMEYPAEKISICSFHRLFSHEVMRHEGYTVRHVLGRLRRSTRYHRGKILHDEMKRGKFGGEMNTYSSERPADLVDEISIVLDIQTLLVIVRTYINDSSVLEGRPGVIVS